MHEEFTDDHIEVRNPDGHLVFIYDSATGTIEIKFKAWMTQVKIAPSGEPQVTHVKV